MRALFLSLFLYSCLVCCEWVDVAAAAPARPFPSELSATRPAKSLPAAPTSARAGAERLIGDTIEQAFPIAAIPFTDTLMTCAFTHDYDETCPSGASLSPDAVYAFTPANDILVLIDLCLSLYDTKVYVYENSYTPGTPYACNDDYCDYQSKIPFLDLWAGNTYYVVVDGYMSDCGECIFTIAENLPCKMECPPGGVEEKEPVCHDNYVDSFNGGCGSDPEAFSVLEPSDLPIEVCGESGTFLYEGMDMRDTDWYEITPAETTFLDVCCQAQFPVNIGIIDGNEQCWGMYIREFAYSDYCETACVSDTLPPGLYWLWVAPQVWEGVDCGSEYLMTVDGYREPATAVAGPGLPSPPAKLLTALPNPFNPQVTVRCDLPEPASVRLAVYGTDGGLVSLLADGFRNAGSFKTTWDGTDRSGRSAPPGVYFVRLEAGRYVDVRKVTLLK